MKQTPKIIALIASLMIAGFSGLSAQSQSEVTRSYTLPSFTVEGVADPELQSYVTPRVPSYLVGSKITMYYTIDTNGDVRSIRSNAVFTGGDLASMMTQALRSWHFEPARNAEGETVAIKVAMPVEIVPQGSAQSSYASIQLKDMKLVAQL